ncbi:unnamed protein product [Mucor hiemalis]
MAGRYTAVAMRPFCRGFSLIANNDDSSSYCIEHALTQKSKCADCKKVIPRKSLRVAEIYRSSKKIKKDKARHTWYHFRCWKVPDYLTRVPIEQFRGFKTLNEKDKERVEKVIKSGTGSSWAALLEKNKPVKTEEQLEADKEEKAKKDKKKKEDDESMNMDMTEVLTGTQQKKTNNKKKVAEPTIEKVEKKKDALKPKTDKKNKVIKKKESAPVKAKEINLPKEDLDELANFDKLFAKLK